MTSIGNIDRGQPPRFEPGEEDEELRDELRDLVHASVVTSEDLATIQCEVVAGLSKRQSQVEMSDEASAAWDSIAAEVARGAAGVWDLPLEVPDVPTDITRV